MKKTQNVMYCERCEECGDTGDLNAAEYFDSHTCRGSGDWCFCDDTMHNHCDQCDNKCNYNRDYEC